VDIFADVKGAKSLREALFYIFGDPVDVAIMKERAEKVYKRKKEKTKLFYKIRRELS
jgi:hypothetical protein